MNDTDEPQAFEAPQSETHAVSAVALPTAHKPMAALFKSMGLKSISAKWIKDFNDLGLDLNPSGLMRQSRAGAVITQQCVIKALADTMGEYETAGPAKRRKIADLIARLARTATATNKEMAETARKEMPATQAVASPQAHTFVPLQVVVNVPQNPKPTEGTTVDIAPKA